MISVLVVDDHQLVRIGLAGLIDATGDLQVVGQAGDGREAVTQARALSPDVILMDLSMPVLDGVQATRELSVQVPSAAILVLTSFSDHAQVSEALEAGAIGYLLKDCDPADLLTAVRAAARGQSPIDPRVAAVLLPGRAPKAVGTTRGATTITREQSGLSAREIEVLALVSTGMANKQIGRRLGISERTVKTHLGSIFRRISVNDRTSAALWAREHLPP